MFKFSNLFRDVETSINNSRSALIRLRETRETLQEQRLYLMHVSRSFSFLVKTIVNDVYVHEFFNDAMISTNFKKRLRAMMQNVLLKFAKKMRHKEHN